MNRRKFLTGVGMGVAALGLPQFGQASAPKMDLYWDSFQFVYKQPGAYGTSDPLMQYATYGWKGYLSLDYPVHPPLNGVRSCGYGAWGVLEYPLTTKLLESARQILGVHSEIVLTREHGQPRPGFWTEYVKFIYRDGQVVGLMVGEPEYRVDPYSP